MTGALRVLVELSVAEAVGRRVTALEREKQNRRSQEVRVTV